MKVIRFIFALYVLFLAVYPCSDSNTCVDEQKAGVALIASDDHAHTSNEQDSCTPFCICSCCAAHIQLHKAADISFALLIHNTQLTTLYQEKPLLNTSNSIWQPPRI
ncbi:MAG: DUF6660 family protein [Bacteroidota bacterium]